MHCITPKFVISRRSPFPSYIIHDSPPLPLSTFFISSPIFSQYSKTASFYLKRRSTVQEFVFWRIKKMGFPVGYTDLFLPKMLVYFLTALGFIRKFVSAFFSLLGFRDFVEPQTSPYPPLVESGPEPRSVSAVLIREVLPVVKFSDLVEIVEAPENCAVCLYEFCRDDEIRRLRNCRHIFHRSCLDRWLDHDQKTCPLCRTQFIPEDMQESFNERLWAASGISDLYGENPQWAIGRGL